MTADKLVTKAYNYAMEKHKDQKSDEGTPYFNHPNQVAEILKKVTLRDPNLICAAYLHDVIEDCKVTYEELKEEFNEDIADLVNEVTHEGEKNAHGYYFPRLKTKRGIILKFADRLSNISRMEAWDEERKEQYLRKSKFWRSE